MQPLLSSLSLNQPNRKRTKLYSTLLENQSKIESLSLISTLGSTQSYHSDHNVVRTAWGHTGCVNTMHWEEGREGRLATAGDDTKICIWKPGLERSTSTVTSEGVSQPGLDLGLEAVIDTGHRANIFNIKWAPFLPSRLMTAAGDDQVRIFDLNASSSSPTNSGNRTWTHYDQTACVKVLKCHTDRVKKICLEDSPDLFLTCAEDGTVRQHDLRTTHTCGRNCPPPLLSYPALSLYSLSISKMRPWMFVVAGTSRWAFLHDRRMIKNAMQKDWNIEMEDDSLTQCVRRFGVPMPERAGEGERHISNHVIATKLSDRNPTELIVSYSDDKIYLFDTDEPSPSLSRSRFLKSEADVQAREKSKFGEESISNSKRHHATSSSDEDGIKVSSKRRKDINTEVVGAESVETEAVQATEGSVEGEVEVEEETTEMEEDLIQRLIRANEMFDGDGMENPIITAGRLDSVDPSDVEDDLEGDFEDLEAGGIERNPEEDEDEDDEDDDEDDDEEDSSDEDIDNDPSGGGIPDSLDPFSRHHYSPSDRPIPVIAPRKSYTGHLNVETVKDVNFAFSEHYVVSGSDDGNWFLWEKESGLLKGIFKGDSSIVNVLQPHPDLPLIAISGIDTSFKIFGPTTDLSERANLIEKVEEITAKNLKRRRRDRGQGDGANDRAQALFQLLSARINRAGAEGDIRTMIMEDGTEEQCTVM